MNSEFQEFLKEVLSAARKYYGSRLEKIVLFGSYARGDQQKDSDVNLMIVLKDERINAPVEILNFGREVYPIGWK
ncbi:MAG: nucleotidyltransferase domain-containing protein [Chitinophagales bacterium]|nr:nucleotidyltransferase domain-containing protein [Chitinophagales bacterium]